MAKKSSSKNIPRKPPSGVTPPLVHAANAAWRKVDDESVILNVDTSDYYSLNPVGSLIWESLGKKKKPKDIVLEIAKRYSISETQAQKDFDRFLASLQKEGLLSR